MTHKNKHKPSYIKILHEHKKKDYYDILKEEKFDEEEDNEIEMRNRAKEFHKKMQKEIYTPFQMIIMNI